MADIFISYSKLDPEHTIALAADLEARGHSTWWDSSLLPGDEFPDLIKRQIDLAKAVLVIWTPNSVKSRWVRAEAARGDNQGKLITLYVPGLDFRDIPMPFNTLHCEPVTSRDKLYAALHRRGVTLNGASRPHGRQHGEDAAALYERGEDYFHGRNGVAQDDRQATVYYRRAADLGDASAISNLGWMYQEGRGVARDDAEAVRLYRKAADMGVASAINNLGWMYQEGRGVARDDAEAIRLFRKAADMGNAAACNYLAYMYENGEGIERSREDARLVSEGCRSRSCKSKRRTEAFLNRRAAKPEKPTTPSCPAPNCRGQAVLQARGE